MNNKQLLATVAIGIAAVPGSVNAQAVETGWYAAANIGMGNLASSSLTYSSDNVSEGE